LSISVFVKLAERLSENGLLLFGEDFENFLQKLRIWLIHKYRYECEGRLLSLFYLALFSSQRFQILTPVILGKLSVFIPY
jgi:hypothetical protein